MRASLHLHSALALLALAACGAALAQPAPAASAPITREETVLDRHTQRVEHIHTEDAGSRVDEVRAGGETKRIVVQPKTSVPAYEVLPADATGTSAGSRESGPGAAGRRVWKLQF